jgi:pimeloyl-ACP methyl ester carboxylesterase
MAHIVGFRLGLEFLLAHLSDASSGCVADAPMQSTYELPLLVYSHGFGGNMDMASYFFRTMANKGMIVAALEHTDGTASSTVLKNGSERKFNEYYMTGRQQLTRRASELLEAVEYIPKEIERLHMVQVGTVMVGGHSFGAPSAVMAANGASKESNISGVILHDPALGMGYGMLPPNGAKSRIPTVTFVSDEYNKANVRYGDLTLHVKGASHGNFVDAPLWAPLFVMRFLLLVIPAVGSANPIDVHEQLSQSAFDFIRTKEPASPDIMRGRLLEFIQ